MLTYTLIALSAFAITTIVLVALDIRNRVSIIEWVKPEPKDELQEQAKDDSKDGSKKV